MATECPADFISLSVPLWQSDAQRFFNDTVKPWGQLGNSARRALVFPVVSAQSRSDCDCDKGHSGYINTHGGHDGNRSMAPQPDQRNRPDRALIPWDPFHCGLSERQCHPLVRGFTTHFLEDVPSAWGEDMWQWFRTTVVRHVCHGGKSDGWLDLFKGKMM